MNYNKCFFAGNLTRNPELRNTNSGMPVCEFCIAVNGKKKEDVVFIVITAFGKMAESISRYFTKGSSIWIESHVVMRSWTDKETGKQHRTLEHIADNFEFIDRKQKDDI